MSAEKSDDAPAAATPAAATPASETPAADAPAAPEDKGPTSREEAEAMGFSFVTNLGAGVPSVIKQTQDYIMSQGYDVYIDNVALDANNKPIPDMISIWRRRPPAAPAA